MISEGLISRNQAEIEHGYHLMKDETLIEQERLNDLQREVEKEMLRLENESRRMKQANETTTPIPNNYRGHDGWFKNYPHVGPGNKILSKSTNEIDEIARQHDIAYSNAKTTYDVIEADKIFLEHLSKIQPQTWGASVMKQLGLIGIGAKANIEHYTGKIWYPSVNDTNNADAPSNSEY